MQANFLKCPFCQKDFNREKRLPYILIECGHSICQKCLALRIGKQCTFKCPMDQMIINTNDRTLRDFPKNQALLNLIDCQNDTNSYNSYSSPKHSFDRNSAKITKNLSEKASNRKNFNSKQNLEKRNFMNKDSCQSGSDRRRRLTTNREESISDDNSHEGGEEVCYKHHKKLEVICTEDSCQVMVCYQCGLFGEHSVD